MELVYNSDLFTKKNLDLLKFVMTSHPETFTKFARVDLEFTIVLCNPAESPSTTI